LSKNIGKDNFLLKVDHIYYAFQSYLVSSLVTHFDCLLLVVYLNKKIYVRSEVGKSNRIERLRRFRYYCGISQLPFFSLKNVFDRLPKFKIVFDRFYCGNLNFEKYID